MTARRSVGTFKCKKMTTSGNATYEGGYCTKICTADTQCVDPLADGGSSTQSGWCIGLSPAYGEADQFCWDRCGTGQGNCRTPGYGCYNLGMTTAGTAVTACWISPVPTPDAGPPSDKLGTTCTTNQNCANPPDLTYALCIPEFFALADGGVSTTPTGYTGGYCSANCGASASVCGAAGICLGDYPVDGRDSCALKCTDPGAGMSNCGRNGYVCQPFFTGLPDGGAERADAGFCDSSCLVPGGPISTPTRASSATPATARGRGRVVRTSWPTTCQGAVR